MREFAFENKGAGLYGAPAPSHVTACTESHNPFGHNPECKCGWAKKRPSQTVPCQEPEFPASRHNDLFDPPEAA